MNRILSCDHLDCNFISQYKLFFFFFWIWHTKLALWVYHVHIGCACYQNFLSSKPSEVVNEMHSRLIEGNLGILDENGRYITWKSNRCIWKWMVTIGWIWSDNEYFLIKKVEISDELFLEKLGTSWHLIEFSPFTVGLWWWRNTIPSTPRFLLGIAWHLNHRRGLEVWILNLDMRWITLHCSVCYED